MTVDAPQVIELAGVKFTPDDVTELDGGQVMVRVSRRDVRGMVLRHGFHSAHPLLQVLFGAVLAAIGLLPTWHFTNWLLHGGTFVSVEALLMGFVFLGPWLMFNALQRGPYLEVRTESGTRKLAFDGKLDPGQLDTCLAAAEQLLGYSIDRGAVTQIPARNTE
jgi:hypothetical protein